MTAIPPAQPEQSQPVQAQPPVVYPGQGYVQHPNYTAQQPYVQAQPYAQPLQQGQPMQAPQQGQAPYFPNGSQGAAYAPSTGLQARVRGNWTWAIVLFVGLPVILIPIGIVILIVANVYYHGQ